MKNTMTIITANAVKEIKNNDYQFDLLREIAQADPDAETETILTEYFDTIVIFKDDKAEMAATRLIDRIKNDIDRLDYRNDYDDYEEDSDADSVWIGG